MKYQSEIVKEIVDSRGHEKSSLHYQSECIETWIKESEGSYPKLCDYQSEWLNYINESPLGEFPYETLVDVTKATINNVVPYAYKTAILKGSTKYRDIDTGEILESFEEGRNLELVSVKMPVLTTTGKNLFDGVSYIDGFVSSSNDYTVSRDTDVVSILVNVNKNTDYTLSAKTSFNRNAVGGSLKPISIGTKTTNLNSERISDNTIKFNSGEFTNIIIYLNNSKIDIEDIQVEEGTVTTSYEPYKSNILTVNEEVELRAIGDIRDELDLMTGELTERVGYNIVDGVNLKAIRYYPNDTDYAEFHVEFPELKAKAKTLSTFSPSYSKQNKPNNAESFWANDGRGVLGIVIQKTKLSEISIDGLNEYLKSNPIKFYYELETESIKTVDLTTVNEKGETTHFKPLEGTMHLTASSETINPLFSGEIPVEAITQNLASFIDLEMRNNNE